MRSRKSCVEWRHATDSASEEHLWWGQTLLWAIKETPGWSWITSHCTWPTSGQPGHYAAWITWGAAGLVMLRKTPITSSWAVYSLLVVISASPQGCISHEESCVCPRGRSLFSDGTCSHAPGYTHAAPSGGVVSLLVLWKQTAKYAFIGKGDMKIALGS